MSLYNLMNGVNPATFFVLPMLDKHPDDYPRFRDCFVTEDNHILVLTRVGGGNRNCGYGEEKLCESPHFIKTFDADWDSTYGYYEFKVPDEWKEDFDALMKGENPSQKYIEQMCKIFPKLEEKFRERFSQPKESKENEGN